MGYALLGTPGRPCMLTAAARNDGSRPRGPGAARYRSPEDYAQGWATIQLTSSAHAEELSKVFEPPLLAM
ncbi:hypothetical protein Sme01_66100 [Sphaerisporangium melleum]|nr:hypothetical protein Sme01_66100 [Sphaerisporangium melleum]